MTIISPIYPKEFFLNFVQGLTKVLFSVKAKFDLMNI
jgi:hypothetical protein